MTAADADADATGATASRPATTPALVPAPREIALRPGPPFRLGDARVVAPVAADPAVRHLVERAAAVAGARLTRSGDAGPGAVVLVLDAAARLPVALDAPDAPDAPGAYLLDVSADGVRLTAADLAGLHHGVATLLQLTDPESATVTAAHVADAPRFAWRGLSLDVARHPQPVTAVLALLDVMADLRLNTLHLHLTDDQGWRLDVPSHPELAVVSGATAVDGDPGGWYSAADYAAIQDHAARRGVVVVPEIDLPGHVNAAQHALPELNPSGRARPAYLGIDVGFSRLHADLAATAPFIRSVLADVAAMTVGPYVHIGGDEPPEMPAAEYAALVELAADAVRAAGKTVVGWQEAARAALPPGSVVQYWDERSGADVVAAAAAAGARVLLSPATRTYLDMKYDATTPVGLEWAGHIRVRDAYDWEPLAVLPDVAPADVIGVEAAVWAETIRTPDDLFFLLLPRLAAFAEVAWSARRGVGGVGRAGVDDVDGFDGFDEFAVRLASLGPRWDAAGLPWYRTPEIAW